MATGTLGPVDRRLLKGLTSAKKTNVSTQLNDNANDFVPSGNSATAIEGQEQTVDLRTNQRIRDLIGKIRTKLTTTSQM